LTKLKAELEQLKKQPAPPPLAPPPHAPPLFAPPPLAPPPLPGGLAPLAPPPPPPLLGSKTAPTTAALIAPSASMPPPSVPFHAYCACSLACCACSTVPAGGAGADFEGLRASAAPLAELRLSGQSPLGLGCERLRPRGAMPTWCRACSRSRRAQLRHVDLGDLEVVADEAFTLVLTCRALLMLRLGEWVMPVGELQSSESVSGGRPGGGRG
jgi:hypothetical protein